MAPATNRVLPRALGPLHTRRGPTDPSYQRRASPRTLGARRLYCSRRGPHAVSHAAAAARAPTESSPPRRVRRARRTTRAASSALSGARHCSARSRTSGCQTPPHHVLPQVLHDPVAYRLLHQGPLHPAAEPCSLRRRLGRRPQALRAASSISIQFKAPRERVEHGRGRRRQICMTWWRIRCFNPFVHHTQGRVSTPP